MAKVDFKVLSTAKGRTAPIYVRFISGRNIDLKVKTPIKVYPKHWSNSTRSFKQRILFDELFTEKERAEIEQDLRGLNNHIHKEFNKLSQSGMTATKEWLLNAIDKYFNKTSGKEENFNQYIDRFIREAEAGQRLYEHNGRIKRYEKNSIKAFRGFKSQFDAYQSEKRVKLNYGDITTDFYDKFVGWFTAKGYSNNTIGRHIKHLKSLMRSARDEGLHNNQEIERKKFRVLRERVQNIYLSEAELRAMFKLDLSGNRAYELARDVFLIGCYTAQRFGDYSRIKPENIKTMGGNKVLDLTQQKTGERVIIPIDPTLDHLLQKYNYHVPKIWEQKLNLHIKEVGRLAGITEHMQLEKIQGGMKVQTSVAKCDLIKTHTARRSACTNMYLAGIPTIDIMKFSGHKTEKEFLTYIAVDKEQTATNLAGHPYFNKPVMKVAK